MDMTYDEIMAAGKKHGIDMSKYEPKIKSKYGQTQAPQPTPQPAGMTQNTDINALIQRAMPQKNIGHRIGDAVSILGGGKPVDEMDPKSNPYLEEYMKQAAKEQFEDPGEKLLKEESLRSLIEARKRGPFWASQPGQEYYQARTHQAEAIGQQAQTETDMMNQVKERLGTGGGSGITPGTTMQAGPYNIPLNPKLDADQTAAISSTQVFSPQANDIAKEVKGGIFGPENSGVIGNVNRTFRQIAVDSGFPLLTSMDPKLQSVQSDLNSIRRYAFGEGGKNLTENEKGIVFKLLDVTGKSDAQIIEDHQKALASIQAKSNLALGGMNAASQSQQAPPADDFSSMSDEDLRKLAGGR